MGSGTFYLEKYRKIGRFSKRLRPDWGSNARAATTMQGLKGCRGYCTLATVLTNVHLFIRPVAPYNSLGNIKF